MRCPNCDSGIYIEDWKDDTPFQCEKCKEWLQIDIDEGTYYGATHTTLVVVDEPES